MAIRLPNDWDPRPYQRALWEYLEEGGKRAIEIAHRRWGKDDVSLHWAACSALDERVGTYWHMLPEAAQARRAIWDAVDPHVGKRRIDIAFPMSERETTRENEMLIRFKNGSTWQVVGSDNFNSLVGAPPVGIVFSEWAIAQGGAWAYLSPILEENNGWALFITTPRGQNHAKAMLDTAKRVGQPGWFAEVSTVLDSGVFEAAQLDAIKDELIGIYGEAEGTALFLQEYYCSFTAAVIGAIYAKEMSDADAQGRITRVVHDKALPVWTSWDLGYGDSTSIWFFQLYRNEVRVIDCYEHHGEDITFYCDVLKERAKRLGYRYAKDLIPHDGTAKSVQTGKTVQYFMNLNDRTTQPVKDIGLENGINATRLFLSRCWFDAEKCKDGIEALRHYRRQHEPKNKAQAMSKDGRGTVLKADPHHDWSSHYADAFRMAAVGLREEKKPDDKFIAPPIIRAQAPNLSWMG